jgi:phage repressor protein C with HTH and peptisase S24 domain
MALDLCMAPLNHGSRNFATPVYGFGVKVATVVDTYSERLKSAMKSAGIDTAGLSRAVKISYQAVKKAVDGGKFGTMNNIKAARALGVSSEWLATGKGDKYAADPNEPAAPGGRFDNLDSIEQRLIENLRVIKLDQSQLDEVVEFVSNKAAKLRAMQQVIEEQVLTRYGIRPSEQPTHGADARKTEVARAALDVTERLRQQSLFDPTRGQK